MKRTKSRDERGSVSTLTVDCRLQHNCFPHDCRYRMSKIKQTDLDRKVTVPLNLLLHLCNIVSCERQEKVVMRKCRFSREVQKKHAHIRVQWRGRTGQPSSLLPTGRAGVPY